MAVNPKRASAKIVSVADAEPPAGSRSGVQSVTVAARILRALATEGGALPLRRLALATGLSRAKVHRYLVSLRAEGLVVQDAESGIYQIGPTAVTIGLTGLRRLSPLREVHDVLPRLRDRINETVTAAVWGDMGPTITAIEESGQPISMNVRVGSVLPVLTTAIGRVFLAHLPGSTTGPLVDAERRKGRGNAVPPPAERVLATMIADVRATRLSAAQPAAVPGVDAVAAPVFDYRGKIVAVLCVVARSDSLRANWDFMTGALVEAVDALSKQLGHFPNGAEGR